MIPIRHWGTAKWPAQNCHQRNPLPFPAFPPNKKDKAKGKYVTKKQVFYISSFYPIISTLFLKGQAQNLYCVLSTRAYTDGIESEFRNQISLPVVQMLPRDTKQCTF